MNSVKIKTLVIFPGAQSHLGLTSTSVVHWAPERTYRFLSSGTVMLAICIGGVRIFAWQQLPETAAIQYNSLSVLNHLK